MISDTKSSYRPVTSSAPQGSVQSLVLFNVFVCDLDDRAQYALSKFDDDKSVSYTRGLGCHPEGS